MFLSIIIPVYNASNTIEKLVNSILNQKKYTFKFEILIVNDGSTDSSFEILNNLQNSYTNIKVYKKDNGGVGSARNLGLLNSKGNYVWMLDADDFIATNAFEILEKKTQLSVEVDVLHFGYFLENENNEILKKLPPFVDKVIDGILFLQRNDGRLYVWNNIYNTKFLKDNIIKFKVNAIILEDSLFNFYVFSKAKKVKYINKPLYYYTFQEGSVSRKKTLDHLINLGTSSYNVHINMKSTMDAFEQNSKTFLVLKKRLSLQVLGFFYSLIIERYPFDYVKKMHEVYRKDKLLPVVTIEGSFKLKIFKHIVNHKILYLLLTKFNTIIRVPIS